MNGGAVTSGLAFGLLASAAFGMTSLTGVHPSFDLALARPDSIKLPRIGGMDFLSDGKLVISTWEQPGSVYILSGIDGPMVTAQDRNAVRIKRFAFGLHEPLGLKVVRDTIYIMQKQQLTMLLDHDKDGMADEYRELVDSWTATSAFHEFGFGLLERDGFFYGSLSVAVSPGGGTPEGQALHRGTFIKMDPATGSYQPLVGGLRTPVGMSFGPEGGIFVTDVQGDWLPANKLIHIQPGKHYGNHILPAGLYDDLAETAPVAQIHQPLYGNSPGQPLFMGDTGTYRNQMLLPDVTYGGLQRVSMEKVKGQWQGAVFEFSGGLEAGSIRIAKNPLTGTIFVGGIGSTGNWSWKDKRIGLNRLTPNGKSAFEMTAIIARTNGLELEFSEPMDSASSQLKNYSCASWTYIPSKEYGAGNEEDKKTAPIASVQVSADRKRVFLELPVKAKYSMEVFTPPELKSVTGKTQWIRRGLYYMSQIPDNEPGLRTSGIATAAPAKSGFSWKLQGGKVRFQVWDERVQELELFDFHGRLVQVIPGKNGFEMNRQAPGLYLVRLKGRGIHGLQKIVLGPSDS